MARVHITDQFTEEAYTSACAHHCVGLEHPHVFNASRTREKPFLYSYTHFGVYTWHAYTLQVNIQRRCTLVQCTVLCECAELTMFSMHLGHVYTHASMFSHI